MRKLALCAVPFSAAVFLCAYLLLEGWILPAGIACAALSGLGFALRKKGDGLLRLGLIALGLALGLIWCRSYDAVFFAPAQRLDGQTVSLTATVVDWPWTGARGDVLTVRLRLAGSPDVKAQLYTEGAYAAKPGDTLTVTARCKLADTIAGEESDYYLSQGVYLLCYAEEPPTFMPSDGIPARYWPLVVSKAVEESVARCFPADTAGFVTALLTGDKAGLSAADESAFRRAGIAHIVVVSGLHVSFFAGLIAIFIGRRKWLDTAVTIGMLVFFAAVAGNAPSVLRAVFLQSALLVAPLLGRENDKLTSLSAALALLLAWNPNAAASMSLQLSFAAVAGIYLVTGPLYQRMTAFLKEGGGWYRELGRGAFRFVAGTLATTLGALLITVPLSAVYFGSVSLVAPLTNLLTLWAVSFTFVGGLLAALVGMILPGVGGALAWVVSLPARYIMAVAHGISGFPLAAVPAGFYIMVWLVFCYVTILIFCLVKREKKRSAIPVAACAVTLVAAVFFQVRSYTAGVLTVTALDVGQGLCVALSSGGRVALVDCGGNGLADPGDVAADYVQGAGLDKVDLLVLTHYHADHTNGVEELMARVTVDTLAIPDVEADDPLRGEILSLAENYGTKVEFIRGDTDVTLGEATLRLYAPLGAGETNEQGLSVLATAGNFDVLVTGDMSADVEKRLVKYGDLPDLEVLVAGHHGSRYSTSDALLQATWPECAIISVGYNSYGHPTPEAMERMAAAGCEIYRTDLTGAVTVRSH